MKLVTLDSQPLFPRIDISSTNADMIELLLMNETIARTSHESAEFTSYLYRLGHTSLKAAAAPMFDDKQRLDAFSHGIGMYEAISAMVHPIHQQDGDEQATFHIITLHSSLARNFVETLTDARDTFSEQMPRTQHLIGQSARRFCTNYEDYAINGAAIARELDLSASAAS